MLTAIVSDLHLGTRMGIDVTRSPEVRAKLLEAVAPADRVVVLGDLLELRERRAGAVLEAAGPCLDGLAEATEGKQLVIVPGNHDHAIVGPALDDARLSGMVLAAHSTFPAEHSPLARRIAARMPGTEVVLAYPGIRLRDDVYATHGHYLDLHLTVPRLEAVMASAVARLTAGSRDGAPRVPEAYEAVLAPIYSLAYLIAQSSEGRAVTRGGNLSRAVWQLAGSEDHSGIAGLAVGRLAVPLAVSALNLMALGPFGTNLSGGELRRAGLRAMGQVVSSLGLEAEHVIFGHTHRAGPLAGDEGDEWQVPDGPRLTNTGSWLYEAVFVDAAGPSSPYWPGTVVLLRDEGPPEVTNVLGDVDPRRTSAELQ